MIRVILVPIGAVLWFLGGHGFEPGLPNLGKTWRRVIWPVICGVTTTLVTTELLAGILVTGASVVVNSLGYGERKSWLQRVAVALLLGLPAFLIQSNIVYPLITGATFLSLYYLSNKYNWFTWPVVESAVGATQAACLIAALS